MWINVSRSIGLFRTTLKQSLRGVQCSVGHQRRGRSSPATTAHQGKMNLEEYFQRIGFHGSTKPDLATLTEIHRQHVMTVPFENLSIHCGEKIVLDLESIFNKIVLNRRGGWCMEINVLFCWVLKEMGYDAALLSSRVCIDDVFVPQDTHALVKVAIDGKLFIADISFGVSCQIWEPLELVCGKDQPQGPGIFRLTEREDGWMMAKTYRKPKILNPELANASLLKQKDIHPVYLFTLDPREAEYFSETNRIHQTDPTSLFVKKSICSLQTPTGFRTLFGLVYSEVTFKPEEGIDVVDLRKIPEDEIDTILEEKFGLKLANKLQPVSKKTEYSYTFFE